MKVSQKNDLKELLKREDIIIEYLQEAAKIGTWEYDTINQKVTWGQITTKIHERPLGYQPTLEEGILYYREGLSRDTITRVFNNALENDEEFDEELEIVTAKNNIRWIRTIGVPVFKNNKCVKVYGLFQDIHEKNKAVEEKLIKQQQFKSTFDHSAIGMALVGIDGSWLQVNNSLLKMLGYTRKELLQMTFQDITHPHDLNKDVRLLSSTIKGERATYQMEKRYFHKDGSIIWALLSVSLVRNEDGKPLHFISQIVNISEVKEAEKNMNKLLEISQDQNTRLLNFANIVSHNLRSHGGNLKMLLDIIETDKPELVRDEMFPMLQSAVKNLNETIGHLNDAALLKIKTIESLEPVNVYTTVNKEISSINAWAHKANAIITNTIKKDLHVMGVPAYIDSLFFNLLSNAIKYRHPDRDPIITISSKVKKKEVEICVEDNGLGIDLELHGDRLFGMYKTFHKHKDAKGIGLYITKNQVEAMNGTIKVESAVGKGTKFLIYLSCEKN
ncbi:sensor histidine kinase [Patiriisocius hiemis]|uniref:histidine kinase n=1 Tax=Patiriisocius hiemis TaxID=3075604 RepID=A0ABU2YAZ6_9FLAO|nr:PAS domain S-box protein [Constantimarinum sp. W242]MDT0555364.1 PAS domain S-box protein [Constantimarinum sp. W242]